MFQRGKNQKVSELFFILQDKLVILFTFVVLFLFPLYTHNAYYDLSISKYRFLVTSTEIFGACYIICYLLKWQKPDFSHWKWWDLCYLAFLGLGGISVACSQYGKEAFTGEAGRRNGLFIYLIYAVILFVIVSNEKLHKVSLYFLELAGIFVSGIGILNHYGLDPLHFFWDLAKSQQDYFTSTLGHIDTFGTYVGVVFALSSILFLLCEDVKETVFHAVTTLVAMAAIITNSADGAYIAIIVVGVFGVFLINNRAQFYRFLLLVASFGATCGVIGILNVKIEKTKMVNGISEMLTTTSCSGLIMAIAVLLFVLVSVAKSLKWNCSLLWCIWKKGMIVALLVGVVVFVGMLVMANFFPERWQSWIGDSTQKAAILGALQITDSWGNNRGYIWLKSLDYFRELPFSKKLIGTGPDTTYQIYQQICTENFLTDYGLYFDNAHNEYIQILLTHGILGAISYFGWIGCSIIQCFRQGKKNAFFYGIGFAVLAYEGIAIVGINNISVMGITFMLICLGKTKGVEAWKKHDEVKEEKNGIEEKNDIEEKNGIEEKKRLEEKDRLEKENLGGENEKE